MEADQLRFEASKSSGMVSALLLKPQNAYSLLVFAHGAGADMRNAFMESTAQALAQRGIGTLRYQFPYSEKRSRRPDPPPVLAATVRAAVNFAKDLGGGLPLFAGGKSLGGRMTSTAASLGPLPGVRGIVFFGFPLHPSGSPSTQRAEHLAGVTVPMLFLQGTRDALADLSLLEPVCKGLGERATLAVFDGADHSFRVPKRAGESAADIVGRLADAVARWSARLLKTR